MLGETRLFASETAATECTCPVLLEEMRTGRAQKLNHKSLSMHFSPSLSNTKKRSYVCDLPFELGEYKNIKWLQ